MKKIVLSVLVLGSLLAASCKDVKKEATDLKDAAVETSTDAAGTVVEGVKDVTNSVVKGSKDAAGTVVDGAKDATNSVVEGAKDAAGSVAEGAKDMVSSSLSGVTIPNFSNAAVTENLTEYASYAKDYIAAEGNKMKLAALAPKGAELLAKGKELASTLDTAELTKYKSALSAIQAKMTSAN